MRVQPVPDIGDVLLKDTDWSQSPVLKGIYDSMRHDAATKAARAADLALDNQDLRAVVVFIVETLVLDEDVARSCFGRRALVAACGSSTHMHRRSTGASGASRTKRNASQNCARRRARAAGGFGVARGQGGVRILGVWWRRASRVIRMVLDGARPSFVMNCWRRRRLHL